MDKVKKWVVDLADPMLKAYINYGHGLEEDGVSVTAKGIEFLAEFEPGLYPMYAIELREYVDHMGIAIEDVQEIHLVAAAYDENEEEIELDEDSDYGKYNFSDFTSSLLSMLKSSGIVNKAAKFIRENKNDFIDLEVTTDEQTTGTEV